MKSKVFWWSAMFLVVFFYQANAQDLPIFDVKRPVDITYSKCDGSTATSSVKVDKSNWKINWRWKDKSRNWCGWGAGSLPTPDLSDYLQDGFLIIRFNIIDGDSYDGKLPEVKWVDFDNTSSKSVGFDANVSGDLKKGAEARIPMKNFDLDPSFSANPRKIKAVQFDANYDSSQGTMSISYIGLTKTPPKNEPSTRKIGKGSALITSPDRGETIDSRKDFPVSIDIGDFDSKARYWVALANIKNHEKTWQKVLQLQKKESRSSGERAELMKLMDEWDFDLFWPKFVVPRSPYQGRIFDGGMNPLSGREPQPMAILILKVDEALERDFIRWLKDGEAGRCYPGISKSKLGKDAVLYRCEIFFP